MANAEFEPVGLKESMRILFILARLASFGTQSRSQRLSGIT
jgi:hypothetical protein